jgi:hypothetical protein
VSILLRLLCVQLNSIVRPLYTQLEGRNSIDDVHETPVDVVPLPPYSESYSLLDITQDGFGTRAKVAGKHYQIQD